ncbi:hypothetical protein QUF72_14580 [Desulfobacterales bacterium HSG2]|nr:hypothetical protein [Desulfobacterales bacterium HSG2]
MFACDFFRPVSSALLGLPNPIHYPPALLLCLIHYPRPIHPPALLGLPNPIHYPRSARVAKSDPLSPLCSGCQIRSIIPALLGLPNPIHYPRSARVVKSDPLSPLCSGCQIQRKGAEKIKARV